MNQVEPVDTLIISVGTRQIGWRCQDGVIRSFGADGNISYPRHVDELYQELGIERGNYQEIDEKGQEKTCPWSARDIGKRYYDYCVEWLGGDFSQVELLLDSKIIEKAVKQGLKHIILWGTDQPENVSWFYRRLDTLWLAKLMAGKIRQQYPKLRVDVHTPVIHANDSDAIRQELEVLIIPEILDYFSSSSNREFVLWIQNKGCTPAIASGVEICAAALVRQCRIFNATPNEPEEFFPTLANGARTASYSQDFKLIAMGEYFWSLEKLRVISAWQRGDFGEAQIWLKVHLNRHSCLYKLAGILTLYTNWEMDKFIPEIGNLINSKEVAKIVDGETIKSWQEALNNMKAKDVIKTWESAFLIELALTRKNYTAAFMQFAQTIERLLFIQFTENRWLEKGFVTIPPEKKDLGNKYNPGFTALIKGWCNSRRIGINDKWYKLLDRIREKRNELVHQCQSLNLYDIRRIWNDGGLFPVKLSDNPEVIRDLMFDVLQEVTSKADKVDLNKLLVRNLYHWGLTRISHE